MDDKQIASLLGYAALKMWSDFPTEAQELLFKAAASEDGVIANSLATALHDRHPRTALPHKPTAIA